MSPSAPMYGSEEWHRREARRVRKEAGIDPPLPPEEWHDDPRQVLIDALTETIGPTRSPYPLDRMIASTVVTHALAALAGAGYQIVKVENATGVGRRTLDGTILPGSRAWGYEQTHERDEWYGPWRPVGEDDTDAH